MHMYICIHYYHVISSTYVIMSIIQLYLPLKFCNCMDVNVSDSLILAKQV